MPTVRLKKRPGDYAICRLEPDQAFPTWADGDGVVSFTRSPGELSVVCPTERVANGVQADPGWTAFSFVGPFAFDETGIVMSVISPLSAAGIGVFVLSTFDADHLLLKTRDLQQAEPLLLQAGHQII